ncbi:MAG: 3-keto-5-aminohexanoate cleavage protein [Shimia sp.]
MIGQSTSDAPPAFGEIPVKITSAPNGARRGSKDHPALPVTIVELVQTAKACFNAGADEIHLHVRDDQGVHTLDPGRYREAISAIHESVPEMAIQVTTEAAGLFEVPDQLHTLRVLVPKAASISVREIARDTHLAHAVYGLTREAGIHVQHILYDAQDAAQLSVWQKAGLIDRDGCDVLLVLGQYAPPRVAQVEELPPFLKAALPLCESWMICAFGHTEHEVAKSAMALGGNIRIGFENNFYRPDGELALDNAENIFRAVEAAKSLARPLFRR